MKRKFLIILTAMLAMFSINNGAVYSMEDISKSDTNFNGLNTKFWAEKLSNVPEAELGQAFELVVDLSKLPNTSGNEYDSEGRTITLEFDDFYLVTCYVPNSKRELIRLDSRMRFEDLMRNYLNSLREKKNVIYCGDLNVSHQEIDIKNPDSNRRNAGFTDEERGKMTELLDSGFVDTFRYLYPTEVKYSWWSYMRNARSKNIGWRLDYFIVNKEFIDRVVDSKILSDIEGSDHCPIELEI